MNKYKIKCGDNIEVMRKMPDNSIDSCVTDGPYGLSFMNKKWDYDVPSVDFWKEVYRVLKPGGHILSFGGTRTYHRMVVNIEDAGFEIRDQVMWLYGSGFPKSLNIGKAVDKLQGNRREIVKDGLDYGHSKKEDDGSGKYGFKSEYKITKGQSKYEGWGTNLKPSVEPICVARKPLSEKSVADNVIKWGTGGINIDGCRVGNDMVTTQRKNNQKDTDSGKIYSFGLKGDYIDEHEGRFPANIILDETAAELLDEQSGMSKTRADLNYKHNKTESNSEVFQSRGTYTPRQDSGGASRFFFVAKVSKKERNLGLDSFDSKLQAGAEFRPNHMEKALKGEDGNPYGRYTPTKNIHPTLKPINLMTYLCRLITPEGGIVLDPFMGSGSTGIAALLEGFDFVGIEMDKDYFKIAEARINNWEQYRELLKK